MQVTFLRSSSYNRWDWCQHLFVLEYGMGYKGPANKKAEAGNIIHKAMEGVALYQLGKQQNLTSMEYPEMEPLDLTKPIDFHKIFADSFSFYANKSEHSYTDEDREELARLIKEGFTSGRLDNGEGKHISWSIYLDVWED